MTKLNSSSETEEHHIMKETNLVANDDFSIRTGENTNVSRISSALDLAEMSEPVEDEPILGASSHLRDGFHSYSDGMGRDSSESSSKEVMSRTSSRQQIVNFDVYEREGYDQIMRTVAGDTHEEEATFAKSVCKQFEILESLTPGR